MYAWHGHQLNNFNTGQYGRHHLRWLVFKVFAVFFYDFPTIVVWLFTFFSEQWTPFSLISQYEAICGYCFAKTVVCTVHCTCIAIVCAQTVADIQPLFVCGIRLFSLFRLLVVETECLFSLSALWSWTTRNFINSVEVCSTGSWGKLNFPNL
jgi:hypothetical protein